MSAVELPLSGGLFPQKVFDAFKRRLAEVKPALIKVAQAPAHLMEWGRCFEWEHC